MMKYDVKAIPTIYNGVQYRSRLEARWCAMFDLLGWKNQYEPFDCNGWIPDFILFGEKEILVEVKPYATFDEFRESGQIKKILNAISGTSKQEMEILLLGYTLFEHIDGYAVLGWLSECEKLGNETINHVFGGAMLNLWNETFGFIHQTMSYKDRITGIYDGNANVYPIDYVDAKQIWNEAGNMVQWTPPAGTK